MGLRSVVTFGWQRPEGLCAGSFTSTDSAESQTGGVS